MPTHQRDHIPMVLLNFKIKYLSDLIDVYNITNYLLITYCLTTQNFEYNKE